MILPVCHHTLPTKSKLDEKPPASTGWIFCCRECYEIAARQNLVTYADATLPLKLEARLRDCLKTIQELESDVQDYKMSKRTAFLRCVCGRIREINQPCRGCGA